MPAKILQRTAEGRTYCHVYNKGLDGKNIFADDSDYLVFLGYLEDYLSPPKTAESVRQDFTVAGRVFRGIPHLPKNYFKKVKLVAYNLQPNHFHLLLDLKTQKSLQAFMRSLCTRYSIYFNKKYSRTGTLFSGPYRSVVIKDEGSLFLLSGYLHKNSAYSSYPEHLHEKVTHWVEPKLIQSIKYRTHNNYKIFVEKYKPDSEEETLLKNLALEDISLHLDRRDLTSHIRSRRIP